ncbi:hypothetical protein QAD02_007530 [Eretmocerus hayati]|uniref:Uncharacterized protein n=1 Tax=Eretmocerus hayati TaxID=131215 RepID=A0ACC2N543_9HYME|nr:hypothetical protein QAD02_007530 [Eretmocerus hayati]
MDYVSSLSYVPLISSIAAEDFVAAFNVISNWLETDSSKFKSAEVVVAGDFNLAGYQWKVDEERLLLAVGSNPSIPVKEGVAALELCMNQLCITSVFSSENSKGNHLG